MEEQPSFEPNSEAEAAPHRQTADWIRRIGRILLVSFVGSAFYALVVGPRNLTGFSNGLFIAGAILLTIGIMPLVSEIFSRATVTLRLEDPSFEDVLEEGRRQVQRGETATYLFGVSGAIIIVLSFIISLSVR